MNVAQAAEKHPGTSTRLLWINIEEEEEGVEHYLTAYREKTRVAKYILLLRLLTW